MILFYFSTVLFIFLPFCDRSDNRIQ